MAPMSPDSPEFQAYAALARAKLAEEKSAREAIDLAREIVKSASAPRPPTISVDTPGGDRLLLLTKRTPEITKRAPARSVTAIRPPSEADLKRDEIREIRAKMMGRTAEMNISDARLLVDKFRELAALEKLEDNGGLITKAQRVDAARSEAKRLRQLAESFPHSHSSERLAY